MTYSAIVPLPVSVQRRGVFAPIGGVPALVRAVRALTCGSDLTVVAAAGVLVDEARDCLTRHGLAGVAVVPAEGGRRVECVEAGLAHVLGTPVPPPYVLIHDHRRPLTPPEVADRVLAALRAGAQAVVPVLPFTDSAKTVDEHGTITGTLDRSTLRTAQYPRGFAAEVLIEAVARRAAAEFDELAEARRGGVAVTLVDGDPDGFAAELPGESALVEAIIAGRAADPR